MENFLKKYSNVPTEIMTDFFNISNENYRDNEVIIDFSKIVKWLEVRKDHLKRLLLTNLWKE